MTNSEKQKIQEIWPLRNAIGASWHVFVVVIVIQVLKVFTIDSPMEIVISLLYVIILFLFVLFFFLGLIEAIWKKSDFKWEIQDGTLVIGRKGKQYQYSVSELTDVGLHRSVFDKLFGLGSVSARFPSEKETPNVIATIDGTRGIGSGATPYVARLEYAGIRGNIIHFPGLTIKDAEVILENLKSIS